MTFKRARTDEQIAQRRKEILINAKQLCIEHGVTDWSFNELGRRCSISKSNLYRYFMSREEVLMRLLASEMESFVGSLDKRVVGKDLTLSVFSKIVATEYRQHPLFCQLLSVAPSILEHNIDIETAADIKRAMIELMQPHITTFSSALDWIADEDAAMVSRTIAIYAAGLWPIANPSKTIQQLAARPEFECIRFDFETELARFIKTLLLGCKGAEVKDED